MMRSEHVLLVLLALAYIIYRLATRAVGILPTSPDDEPHRERDHDDNVIPFVNHIAEETERAAS